MRHARRSHVSTSPCKRECWHSETTTSAQTAQSECENHHSWVSVAFTTLFRVCFVGTPCPHKLVCGVVGSSSAYGFVLVFGRFQGPCSCRELCFEIEHRRRLIPTPAIFQKRIIPYQDNRVTGGRGGRVTDPRHITSSLGAGDI